MPLRVMFVNPGRNLGGAERCLLLLLRELLGYDVEPTVVLFGDGPFASQLAAEGIPTHFLRMPEAASRASRYRAGIGIIGTLGLAAQSLPSVVRLSTVIRRVKADIVHTNGLKAHLLGGLAGRLARRPVVWHLRDFLSGGAQGRLLRSAARRLPKIVFTVSDAVTADLRSGEMGNTPIMRLHDPIDIGRFPLGLSGEQKRAELSLDRATLVVGMVAHLTPWKGHEVFLRMAKIVADAVPEARFLVVGGSIYETEGHAGYAEKLKRLAVDLGLGGRVQFLGIRDDVPEIMAALDVLVHCPTAPEPFGLVVVEAMAAGRPVVASAAGGILETVQNDVTGLLVKPGEVHEFASAVQRLLRDLDLRRQFGEAGRKRVETSFTPGPHAERVIQVYRDLKP